MNESIEQARQNYAEAVARLDRMNVGDSTDLSYDRVEAVSTAAMWVMVRANELNRLQREVRR